MTRVLALAVAAVFVLAGCGTDDVNLPNVVTNPAPTVGCTVTDTEELYVASLYDCDDTSVYLFNTKDARDSWRKAAEEFGTVVVGEGDLWLEVKS